MSAAVWRLGTPSRWNYKRDHRGAIQNYRPKEHYCTARTYQDRSDICAFGTTCNRLAVYFVDDSWQGHRLCRQHAIQVVGTEAVEAAR